MPHSFLDTAHLNDFHANRFRRESYLLPGVVDLPESPAVRAEIAAMLDTGKPAAQPLRKRARQLRDWFPAWVGWLRSMPVP